MNSVQKELDEAFYDLSAIPVSGNFVEIMASAREHMRRAYRLAASELKEAEPDG